MNNVLRTTTITLLVCLCLSAILFYSCQKNEGDPPNAAFTYTSVMGVDVPATVHFQNTSVSPVGTTSTYAWDFGDGTSATLIDPIHIYVLPGVYQVRLVQIPSAGANDTLIMQLRIGMENGPSGVSSRLFSPQTANFNIAVSYSYIATFVNKSTNADSYMWNFGDGATTNSAADTVKHTYSAQGSYHVTLTALNGNGTDTTGANITFP